MSNAFSKEERVAFEELLEGFNDALVLSKNVATYNTSDTEMERSNDTVWRPQPYIAQSFSGMDQSANFKNYTQLSVPATLGFSRSVPWEMNAKELRDALQEKNLGNSAKQKLASDINVAVASVASAQGTLVVARPGAASGFDDVAQAEAIMNEQGVNAFDRYLALSTRDYNGMAANLAARQTVNGKTLTAYEKAYVGQIASFDTFKLDYANRIVGAGAADVTVSGANQYHVPKATSVAATGEESNVDNRTQLLSVDVGAGAVQAGDCFTIEGVEAVHHITKQSTGQLKTFRVIEVISPTVVRISPAIVSGAGGDASAQYQNVTAAPADGAAITFLNTVSAYANPFWQKDAIELIPGRYAVPTNSGAAVMRAATDQGVEIVMQKFYDINTMKTKFRLDTLFGVVNKQPEMTGIMLFGQS